MSDHLDFIRIRGLTSGEDEVFQGAAGGGSDLLSESGGSLNLDTGSLTDVLKTALLYEDEDGTQHSYFENFDLALDLTPITDKLDAIFMSGDEDVRASIIAEIRDRLADLAFVDGKVDFGFWKFYLKGRTAEI